MAKRKRSTNIKDGSRKKAKVPHAHGEIDPNRFFKLKSIVGEDKNNYLISWEDDEVTGEKFDDTWEPKKNANRQAIKDWEKQKAEKKRLEELSGAISNSPSTSISSTPQPANPTRKRKQRRVIDSSPQPGAGSVLNGHPAGSPSPTDDPIEIGESEEEGEKAETRSPRFEPQHPIVHPSPPPSSYLAGGYQAVLSSQPVSSTEPSQTKKSPEPSQYLPELDTSKTTEDTTDISLQHSTPSAQIHSTPADYHPSSFNVVPDSQSVRESASYVPSGADTATVLSSSALNGSQSAEHIEEPSIASPNNAAEHSFSSPAASSKPKQNALATIPPPSNITTIEDIRISTEISPGIATSQAAETVSGRSLEAGIQGILTKGTGSEELAVQSTDTNGSHTTSSEDDSRVYREVQNSNPRIFAQRTEVIASTGLRHPDLLASGTENERRSEPVQSSQRPELSSRSASQQNSKSQGSGVNRERIAIEHLVTEDAANPSASSLFRGDKVSGTAQVDLTNSQYHTASIGSFAVTSPVRQPVAAFGIAGRRRSPQALSSITAQSPFPFQTQIPNPSSIETSSTFSPQSNIQSQPFPQTYASLHEAPTFSPRASSLPQSQPSSWFASSPIPPAPSQSLDIGTFGESAPPPPTVLSSPYRSQTPNSKMDPSRYKTESGRKLAAKLAAMRERNRAAAQHSQTSDSTHAGEAASLNASPSQLPIPPKLGSPFLLAHDRTRSPSAVPAMEPLATITRDEMNTSRRVETLLPQSRQSVSNDAHQSGSIISDDSSQRQTKAGRDPELASVHAVPVYFLGHQRDQYPQMVHFHETLIQRFLASRSADDELIIEAKRFVDRIRRITIHPDLDDAETLTQYDIEPSQQVKWHSGFAKLHFLRGLLDRLRYSKLHVAIVAEQTHVLDILETFLKGIDVPYYRYHHQVVGDSNALTQSENNLRVSLQESGKGNTDMKTDTNTETVDLVIAMDNSVKYESEHIRTLRRVGDKWSPLVTLVVPYTVEHIERCLSPMLPDRARTRALVSGIYKYRLQAGRPSWGEHVPKDTAQLLAEYLTSAQDVLEWPLPGLWNLEDLDSQTESEVDIIVTNETSKLAVGEKRLRENDDYVLDTADSNKRSRVESPVARAGDMPQTVNPQEIDVTHVSDSIEKATQDSEAGLTPTERRLQTLLRETQDRLDEHVRILNDLQYRHEEQRTKLIEVSTERDAAIDTAQNAISRYTEESNKMSNLRAELSTVKEQLKEANTKLVEHPVPERAEFEALRLGALQVKTDKEKLERRLDQAGKDVAYVRDLYQSSSSSAQALAAQVTDLESQLAVAENRATGELAKLRQMTHDTFTKNLQAENKKLKTMLKEREAGLKFRDEEIAKLKEASRGRMGTRGTSVPRSPRMGSRQTSPAAGELRGRTSLLHPLRNAEV